MTPERQRVFDNFNDLFGHPGWKQYIDELVSDLSGATLVSAIKEARTERDLGLIQGHIARAEHALGMAAGIEASYAAELEDDAR